jgi:hypothetical protein
MLQQHKHWTFINLGHVLSAHYFITLLFCVCDFNVGEIFLLGPRGVSCVGLFYCFNTLCCAFRRVWRHVEKSLVTELILRLAVKETSRCI